MGDCLEYPFDVRSPAVNEGAGNEYRCYPRPKVRAVTRLLELLLMFGVALDVQSCS